MYNNDDAAVARRTNRRSGRPDTRYIWVKYIDDISGKGVNCEARSTLISGMRLSVHIEIVSGGPVML